MAADAPGGWAVTAEGALIEAVLAALRAAPGLAALNRIGSGEAERAPVPHGWIAEISGVDWGTKDRVGRDVRLVLMLADRGDGDRLAALCAAAELALLDLPRPIAGWDHVGLRVLRIRAAQRRDGTRTAALEVRVRLLKQ